MKPWNRIKFAAALKSRADHPLSNFEVHDEVCARCGRERTFANMKHTRLYGYMCVCGAQEWVAAQQSLAIDNELSTQHGVQQTTECIYCECPSCRATGLPESFIRLRY